MAIWQKVRPPVLLVSKPEHSVSVSHEAAHSTRDLTFNVILSALSRDGIVQLGLKMVEVPSWIALKNPCLKWVVYITSATDESAWYQILLKHFNSICPSDPIWFWRSLSTLVQVLACCLTASSYYLNQCWIEIRSSPSILLPIHKKGQDILLSFKLLFKLFLNLPEDNKSTSDL